MHDRGPERPEQPVQLRIEPEALPRRLVQREALDVVALQALAEIGDLGQRDDRVPVVLRRHVVDQVHHAVLETAGVEGCLDG